jgi:CspA family cold shock protein
MGERSNGTVKWFNNAKGFGFITRDSGEDVFVHFRSIRGEGYRTLTQGQPVSFDLLEGPKGLHAEDVEKVDVGSDV